MLTNCFAYVGMATKIIAVFNSYVPVLSADGPSDVTLYICKNSVGRPPPIMLNPKP